MEIYRLQNMADRQGSGWEKERNFSYVSVVIQRHGVAQPDAQGAKTMKRLMGAAVMMAIFIVAGCKMNVTADLYSTDLRAVEAGTAGLTTPGTMAFEVPGADKCNEHAANISEIMEGVVSNFAPRGCEKDGAETFLLADTQMPLLPQGTDWQNPDALFSLLVMPRRNTDHVVVAVVMNLRKYRRLLARMKEKFHQSIDLASSKVVLVLNNDERNTIRFSVRDSFLNGDPIHGEQEFELGRRHKAEIRLSNVTTAYLVKKGIARGIALRGTRY